jgi:hypothetical protein
VSARKRVGGEPPQPARVEYATVVDLTSCPRCGCVLVDSDDARQAHERFHEALRRLWNGRGGEASPAAP